MDKFIVSRSSNRNFVLDHIDSIHDTQPGAVTAASERAVGSGDGFFIHRISIETLTVVKPVTTIEVNSWGPGGTSE